jgi:hypothetical protein
MATLTWEANDGHGWVSGRLVTSEPAVEVRLRAAWEGGAQIGYAFAGCQFDMTLSSDATEGDWVSDFGRLYPFYYSSAQTLDATRFGNTIKIDDRRDTMPPGQGTRGIFPGQLVEQFGDIHFTRANPVYLFGATIHFDGVPGERRVDSRYVAPSGGNSLDRVMRIYTSSVGGQNTPSTTTFWMDIEYVPAPGAAAVLGAAGILVVMRRRRG